MPRTRRQKTQEHEADTTGATTPRRSTRSSAGKMKVEDDSKVVPTKYYKDSKEFTRVKDEEDSEDDDDEEKTQRVYILDGVDFNSYQDFVDAKRKRNEKVLMGLGFGPSSSTPNKRFKVTDGSTMLSQRGLKSNQKKSSAKKAPPVRSRISSRISGDKTKLVALDLNVNNWNKDNTSFVVTQNGGGGEDDKDNNNNNNDTDQQKAFFNDRVNDGSNLNIKDAIEMNDPKWIHDESELNAQNLFKELTLVEEKESTIENSEYKMTKKNNNSTRTRSPTSVMVATTKDTSSWDDDQITDMVDNLSIDKEEWVAKVTPDLIFSVACHPSESKLICCAGDKKGYVGLWDVDGGTSSSESNNNDISVKNSNGVSLFRVHSRPICCLEWLNNENMVTASYDGSVRRLDVETGIFEEIFATYDDSDTTYLEDLGYGLDLGYRYWTQNVTVDHRYKGASNPCLFVSTSVGNVFHVDLRVSEKQKITFHESVSEKKLNTVSLHPNGTTLATSGNDGSVRLFDMRKFRDSQGVSSSKSPKPLCTQISGRSVNSSFFSPSGKSLLTTSYADRFDLTEDAHLHTGGGTIRPTHSIRHNNQTGRWLTTFQATWHPTMDIFCSGSMNRPRCMEVFDSQGRLLRKVMGESLGSVFSRTCFHSSTDKLIMVGGNSSGRMVAIR